MYRRVTAETARARLAPIRQSAWGWWRVATRNRGKTPGARMRQLPVAPSGSLAGDRFWLHVVEQAEKPRVADAVVARPLGERHVADHSGRHIVGALGHVAFRCRAERTGCALLLHQARAQFLRDRGGEPGPHTPG